MGRARRNVGSDGRLHARDADGVGADAKARLQVSNVLHERQDLEPPIGQAEQDADAHVVDLGLHGAVHGRDPPIVVLLLARQVHALVGRAVVGFLEQLVGANARALERAEFIDRQGRDVGIHPADFALAPFHTVDRRNGIQYVLEALARIRLPCHQQDALVALVDQDLDLAADLILRQRPSLDLFVACAKRAIGAVVGAKIGHVERRKQHQPRPVDLIFHRACRLEDLAQQLRIADRGQRGHIRHAQPGQATGLGQHRAHMLCILAGGCRQHANDFALVYKSNCVVHLFSSLP